MAWYDPIVKFGGIAAAPFTGGASLWPALAMGAGGAAAGYGLSKLGGGGDKDKNDPLAGPLSQLGEASQQNRQDAQAFKGMGAEAIGPALQYLKALAGENPSALMDATRGERGRVIDQYDTARRSIASFGPRGGGSASAIAEGRMAEGSQLADITSSKKSEAVKLLSAIGPQLAGLGLNAEQLASQDLSTVIDMILRKQGFDVERRGQNMQALAGIGEAAGMIAAAKMGQAA